MNPLHPIYNIEKFVASKETNPNFTLYRFSSPEILLSTLEKSEVRGSHTHSFYTIFWVEKGEVSQWIDDRNINIGRNNILIISPSQIHQNEIECTLDLKGGIIMFTEEFLQQNECSDIISKAITFRQTALTNPIIENSDTFFCTLLSSISAIETEYNLDVANQEIIQAFFSALIMQLERSRDLKLTEKASNNSLVIYQKFIDNLEINYKANLSVEDYASTLAISSKQLNRIVSNIVGENTSNIIKHRKLLEAKRLLSYSTLSILQIVDELGYTDSSYFNRVFKKEFGISPLAFRKAL